MDVPIRAVTGASNLPSHYEIVGYAMTAENGVRGYYDDMSGRLYVSGICRGCIDPSEDDDDDDIEIVEEIVGGRKKRKRRRARRRAKRKRRRAQGKGLARLKKIGKVTKVFSKIANSKLAKVVARVAPPPISTGIKAAQTAVNVVSNLRRGNPQTREGVERLGQTANDPNAPPEARARARFALRAAADVARSQSDQVRTTARNLFERLTSGDPRARSAVIELRARAQANPVAREALEQIRSMIASRSSVQGWNDTLVGAWEIAQPTIVVGGTVGRGRFRKRIKARIKKRMKKIKARRQSLPRYQERQARRLGR